MDMTYEALVAYLRACHEWTEADCLVVGHPAPDGDAVISSVFEGWRRYIADGQRAMPVVQAATLPREVAWLLGELAPLVLTQEAMEAHPTAPLVLTDHHLAHGRRVLAVVDHHVPAPDVCFGGIPCEIRPVGATTTLVALACRRQGLVPDRAVARLLLGGILLDTDGLLSSKAKAEDHEMAAWLAALAGEDCPALFASLREQLLAERDVPTLFWRDYRLYEKDSARLGFAILKVWEDAAPDLDEVRRLLALDVAARGLTVCVAKISLYSVAGPRAERYVAAGEPQAAQRVLDAVAAAAGVLAEKVGTDEVFLPTEAIHRGRKAMAPRLLEVL
ncbi:MAG: hypothetical protein IIW40_03745 [Clostridia bacterium]|nr:hypothetical protein [Clostridia bacterium]